MEIIVFDNKYKRENYEKNILYEEKGLINVKKEQCKQNVEELSDYKYALKSLENEKISGLLDPSILKLISCYAESIIPTDLYKYIYPEKVLGQGVYGMAVLGSLNSWNKQPKIVLKTSEDVYHELFIGMIMNDLKSIIPNFTYVYGGFLCSSFNEMLGSNNATSQDVDRFLRINKELNDNQWCDDKNLDEQYILMEYIQGKTIEKLLLKNEIDLEQYLLILIQLCLALQVAMEKHQYIHFDLHPGNAMFDNLENHKYLKYNVKGSNVYIKAYGIVYIIDYGMSCVTYKSKRIGLEDTESFGVVSRYIPNLFDVFKFLGFSRLYAVDQNIKLFLDQVLFEFFNYSNNFDKNSVSVCRAKIPFCLSISETTPTPKIFPDKLSATDPFKSLGIRIT